MTDRAGCVFFFKQKTAYEMRISDWSSDVCSSDLAGERLVGERALAAAAAGIIEAQKSLPARFRPCLERECLAARHVGSIAGQEDHGRAGALDQMVSEGRAGIGKIGRAHV